MRRRVLSGIEKYLGSSMIRGTDHLSANVPEYTATKPTSVPISAVAAEPVSG
jgi:hypothetical protein